MEIVPKLTAEKNKEPEYTSVGFKNQKKAPECFKDHQKNSKCHKGAATSVVIVPSCGDFENTFESMVKIYNGKLKV